MNRLTCGALNHLLSGSTIQTESGSRVAVADEAEEIPEEVEDIAPQLAVAKEMDGASYYIIPKYENLTFEVGIYIPDDFEVSVTEFELWCDNIQIGDRTPVGKNIRHLMTATTNVKEVKIRLIDNGSFVADCVIDASVYQGPLEITNYSKDDSNKDRIAAYELDENTYTVNVTLTVIPDTDTPENISYFVLYDKYGTAIGSEQLREVNKGIRYLGVLSDSLDSVTIKLYDAEQNYLYDGTFDMGAGTIKKAAAAEQQAAAQ